MASTQPIEAVTRAGIVSNHLGVSIHKNDLIQHLLTAQAHPQNYQPGACVGTAFRTLPVLHNNINMTAVPTFIVPPPPPPPTPTPTQFNGQPFPQSVSVQFIARKTSLPQMVNYAGQAPVVDNGLGILSAERYDDGRFASRTAGSRGQRKQQQSQQLAFGLVDEEQQQQQQHKKGGRSRDQNQHGRSGSVERVLDRRRKKVKLSEDEDGEDEAAKKARGRPRLDTKDDTAADRRRTQIRMAQRAYRHRKETTIASLEKQVQELRGANEEMSSIFLNLHDFAIQRGILDREREFGTHLASSTQRFIAIAKTISVDESAKEEEGHSPDDRKQTHSPEPDNVRSYMGALQTRTSQPDAAEPHPTEIWGYQMMGADPIETDMPPVPNQDQNLGGDLNIAELDLESFMRMPLPEGQHQIISRATPYNASFSFDTDMDFYQQFNAEVPDVFDAYSKNVALKQTLPATKTLVQHESTFGRQLHRAALERGISLILDPDADPTRLQRVFGFCLRFETRDQIETRLKAALETSSKETLSQWKAPFVHLGGAGTHYPLNEDIRGTLMPKFRTGLSMGPFSSSIIDTMDKNMLDPYQMSVPGFEGAWFDSNDVENYLRSRGIDIAPELEFVSVNLDVFSLQDTPSLTSNSDDEFGNTITSPKTPTNSDLKLAQLLNQVPHNSSSPAGHILLSDPRIYDNVSAFKTWGMNIDDTGMDNITQSCFDLSGPIFNLGTGSAANLAGMEERRVSQSVTISVRVLIEEIVSRTVCLGRSPGFKQLDVESAIQRALNKAY